MSKAKKAEKNSHKPAKYIEDIAGLASSVEVDKNPKYLQSATDGIQPLSQEEFDRKPAHPATSN
jgi:hypothetical protein